MSDLLNSASLVLIPSGYKEDTVYSVVPSDGSGDLSFTRASNGTRVNSAGLVEVVSWNLLTYSEQFDNADWLKQDSTITTNTTNAPNGTLTADTMVEGTGVSTQHRVRQSATISSGVSYTASVYIKRLTGTRDFAIINVDSGQRIYYNMTTNTVANTILGSGTITNVGDGWYRLTASGTSTSTSTFLFLCMCDGTSSTSETYTGNGTSSFAIWGAQLNIGATAKPYFPTTDRLNVPRLTYQNGGGGCPSLLLEPQRTNLLTYSNTFTNATWFKVNSSITSDAIISPDGTQNASKLVESTANDSHHIYQNALSTGSNTFTFYAKAGERKFVYAYADGAGQGKCFDLENGTVGANIIASPTSSSITPAGNGWYRCSITITIVVATALRIGTCSADGTFSYLGNGTSGLYIYGAQCEAGAYPTTYIPTTTASATRVADACFKTGISSLIGQTEGVMFCDFDFLNTTTVEVIMSLHDSADNKRIEIWANGATINGFVGGSSSFNIGSIVGVTGNRYKMAIAYKSGDCAFYVNGTQIATNSTAFTFSLANLSFSYWSGSAYLMEGKINQALLFKTRLTNAELASLTTI
jgi:hypothetical protein